MNFDGLQTNETDTRHAFQRGMGVLEALAAATLAACAALAMIFALASGNAASRSMKIERAATFIGQKKMEALIAKPSGDAALTVGAHGPETAALPHGNATTTWTVAWVDDPLDGSGVADTQTQDYRKLEVTVAWTDIKSRNLKLNTYLYP